MNCYVCKLEIVVEITKPGMPLKYCSLHCKQAAYRLRQKAKKEPSVLDKLLGTMKKAQEVLGEQYQKDLTTIQNVIRLHYTTVPFDVVDESTWTRNRTPKIVAIYDYVDEKNNLLYQVLRLQPKGFRQRRPDPKLPKQWKWNLYRTRRVLYRLPEVLKAVAKDEVIFIVEGEKDANTLAKEGFTATSCVNGAMKWRWEYSESLRNARVVILPDNDLTGQNHARYVKEQLKAVVKEVFIVDLPGLANKGDVTDWFKNGGDKEQFINIIKSRTK